MVDPVCAVGSKNIFPIPQNEMLRVRDRRIIPRTAAVCQIDRRSGAQVKKIQIADVIIVLMLQIQIRFPFFRMKDTAFRGIAAGSAVILLHQESGTVRSITAGHRDGSSVSIFIAIHRIAHRFFFSVAIHIHVCGSILRKFFYIGGFLCAILLFYQSFRKRNFYADWSCRIWRNVILVKPDGYPFVGKEPAYRTVIRVFTVKHGFYSVLIPFKKHIRVVLFRQFCADIIINSIVISRNILQRQFFSRFCIIRDSCDISIWMRAAKPGIFRLHQAENPFSCPDRRYGEFRLPAIVFHHLRIGLVHHAGIFPVLLQKCLLCIQILLIQRIQGFLQFRVVLIQKMHLRCFHGNQGFSILPLSVVLCRNL